MEWIKPGTNFDFVGKRYIFMGISLLIILLGVGAAVAKGGVRLGIDFTGGTEVHLRFNKAVHADESRAAVEKAQLGEPVVQQIGEPNANEYLIRVSATAKTEKTGGEKPPAEKIKDTVNEKFGVDSYHVLREDAVGPRAGNDLRLQGLYAILLSFVGILIYVGIRFDFKFGVGAIVALVHDVALILTLFIVFDKEITLTIIAALLTVIGYSMNDTVIVFDRIRENMRTMRTKKFSEVVNRSVNETLSRTILTSLTMFIVTIVLYLAGGSVLHDFAFALTAGVIVGTYSSIYIASPVVIFWQKDTVVAATQKKRR
jgi:preprotein translocase subunit SecF